jgi:hypothetical protein
MKKDAHWYADERFPQMQELPMHIPTAQECDATMFDKRTNARNPKKTDCIKVQDRTKFEIT